LVPLYLELARAQLVMARDLCDAPHAMLDAVEAALGRRR
jgi:hypothetical protein